MVCLCLPTVDCMRNTVHPHGCQWSVVCVRMGVGHLCTLRAVFFIHWIVSWSIHLNVSSQWCHRLPRPMIYCVQLPRWRVKWGNVALQAYVWHHKCIEEFLWWLVCPGGTRQLKFLGPSWWEQSSAGGWLSIDGVWHPVIKYINLTILIKFLPPLVFVLVCLDVKNIHSDWDCSECSFDCM